VGKSAGKTGAAGGGEIGDIDAVTSLVMDTPGKLGVGPDDGAAGEIEAATSFVTEIPGKLGVGPDDGAAGDIEAATSFVTEIPGTFGTGPGDGADGVRTAVTSALTDVPGKVVGMSSGLGDSAGPVAVVSDVPMDSELLMDTKTDGGMAFASVGTVVNEVMNPVNMLCGMALSTAGLHDSCVRKSTIKNGGTMHSNFGCDDRIVMKAIVFCIASEVFKSV